MEFLKPERQLDIIRRGAENIISEDELLKKLQNSVKENKPLCIKAGFDPTAPDLHFGHLVLLKKLRDFQDLGHEVIFLIGDYTAQIGDPTGKNETRPPISKEEIIKNSKTYEEQVFKILDKNKTKVTFNSSWLDKLSVDDLLGLTSLVNIARILEREDFSNRYKSGISISLKEFIYPLIQAYDSVQIKADIEIGGTDQTFNILLGRDFQRHFDQEPQVAIFLPILEGLDGVKKMSKSLDNYIGISDKPIDIYGKIMSISDDLMWKYYYYFSSLSENEIELIKEGHPMNAKRKLAFEMVSLLHDAQEAEFASTDFDTKFSNRAFPEDAEQFEIDSNRIKTLLDMLMEIPSSLSSRGEAKRLISQGGFSINGKKYTDFNSPLPDLSELEIKLGKKQFIKVVIK